MKAVSCLLFLFLFLAWPAHAALETMVIPAASGEISEGNVSRPNNFFHVRGSSGTLPDIFVAMEFDIAGIDSGLALQSAVLDLNALSSRRGGGFNAKEMDIFVHGYFADNVLTGDEGSVDNAIAGPFHTEWTRGDPRRPDMSMIDVTGYVQTLIDGGARGAGFILKPDNFVGLGNLDMGITSEPGIFATSRYPTLTLTQVPEPSTWALLTLVLLGLLGLRRRF